MRPSLVQIDIETIISNSPSVESLDPTSYASHHTTIFVCSQGFEQRCDAVAMQLIQKEIQIERAVIISLDSNSEQDRENGEHLAQMLSSISAHPPVTVNADAAGFSENFISAIGSDPEQESADVHIIYDISVSANRACIRTLNILFELDCEVTVAYAEAEVYHPEEASFLEEQEVWMAHDVLGTEQGVSDLRVSDEFPGEHLDAASNLVVLFPSFRQERSAAVIGAVDQALLVRSTDDVIWILGRPHLKKDAWRTNAMRTINRIQEDAKVFEASTFDYREAWHVLESVYRDHWETSNITVSPLGSKLQAIAVTLFCLRHSDVKVLFSTPQKYNANQWSEGVRALWQVNFGQTRGFLELILQAGALKLEGFDL